MINIKVMVITLVIVMLIIAAAMYGLVMSQTSIQTVQAQDYTNPTPAPDLCPYTITIRNIIRTVYLPCPPTDCAICNPETLECNWVPCSTVLRSNLP